MVSRGSIEYVTDEDLVLRARQGDTGAFGDLVVRYQGAVYRAALAVLRHPQDAEEVAQDAFVRAWTGLPKFRGQSSFRTWLLTITWNRALVRRKSVVAWFSRRADASRAELLRSSEPDPGASYEATELANRIRKEIEKLSPKLRDALLLSQSGELDYLEIAAMLGVPVGTLKWRVAEARRTVRAGLSEPEHADA